MKSTCLALAMIFCGAAAAQDVPLRGGNILSCETYTFRVLLRTGKIDVIQIPAFYKELGIKGIGYNDSFFTSFSDEYIDRVKAAVKKADRVVTCFVMGGNLATNDSGKRMMDIESDKVKMRAAKRLGSPLVRINIGPTEDENSDDVLGLGRSIAALKEDLLPLARQLNLKIAIENHGGVSTKAANIVKMIQALDPAWVGVAVDFGNFPDATRYEEIAMVAPYAFTTHAKIKEFDASGEAMNYDFPRVLQIFKAQNYKGPFSIEYESSKEDAAEGARKTKALLVKYW